jgi:hypothetical protein
MVSGSKGLRVKSLGLVALEILFPCTRRLLNSVTLRPCDVETSQR